MRFITVPLFAAPLFTYVYTRTITFWPGNLIIEKLTRNDKNIL